LEKFKEGGWWPLMPAQGFLWAFQVGYFWWATECFNKFMLEAWELAVGHINEAVKVLKEAGFDV